MTTNFPAEIDQFDNPQPNDSQAQARTHSQQHGDANDALEAIQRKVGVDGSVDPESLDYKVRIVVGITDGIQSAAYEAKEAFANAAQGIKADSAVQPIQLNSATEQLQAEIAASQTQLQTQIDGLVDGQQTQAIYANTLADLQAVSGSYIGQGGFALNGTGAGQYRWTGSAWEFLRADMLTQKADQADLVQTQQYLSDSYSVPLMRRIPIAGTTNNVGDVVGNVMYDVDTRAVLLNGSPLLDGPSAEAQINANLAGTMGTDTYSAPASRRIPLVGTINGVGDVVANVQYDVDARSLLVNGESAVSPSLRWAPVVAIQPVPVTGVMHLMTYGQSLSNGVNSIPPVSTGQPFLNLTFAQGPRSTKAGSVGQLPGMDSLVPLIENTLTGDGVASPQHGETPCSAWANGLTRRLALGGVDWRTAGPRWLATANGKGSASINNLLPGGSSDLGEWFQVLRDAVDQGRALSMAAGMTYSLPCWLYLQGEGDNADAAMAGGVYLAKLQQLHEAVSAKVQAATGSSFVPWVGVYQTYARTLRERPHATMDQIIFCEQTPGAFHLTALYHLPLASDGHLTALGSYWVGEYAAKKVAQILDGYRPTWLRVGYATLSGRVLRYKPKEIPVAPLRLLVDDNLRQTTDYGFLVRDANGGCAIESIGINKAGDEVVITLVSVPTGAVQLRYGLDYLPTGQVNYSGSAGGNLVDSDPASFTFAGSDYPLYNVSPHFQCDVIPA